MTFWTTVGIFIAIGCIGYLIGKEFEKRDDHLEKLEDRIADVMEFVDMTPETLENLRQAKIEQGMYEISREVWSQQKK